MLLEQGLALGPLSQVSVTRDGPIGEAGTVLWVCKDHKQVLEAWNRNLMNEMLLTQRVSVLASQAMWPSTK